MISLFLEHLKETDQEKIDCCRSNLEEKTKRGFLDPPTSSKHFLPAQITTKASLFHSSFKKERKNEENFTEKKF
jgi:hypothetical protein